MSCPMRRKLVDSNVSVFVAASFVIVKPTHADTQLKLSKDKVQVESILVMVVGSVYELYSTVIELIDGKFWSAIVLVSDGILCVEQ